MTVLRLWGLFFVVFFCLAGAAQSLEDEIIAKERAELECLKQANVQCFGDLISDDAVFVDPHGMATKKQVLANIAGVKLVEFSMADIRFIALTGSSGVLGYKLTEKGKSDGKEFTTVVFASAVWAKKGGKWLSIFSQETPARTNTAVR